MSENSPARFIYKTFAWLEWPWMYKEAKPVPEYVTLISQVPPGWSYTAWQEHLAALIKAEEEKALAKAEAAAGWPDSPGEVQP